MAPAISQIDPQHDTAHIFPSIPQAHWRRVRKTSGYRKALTRLEIASREFNRKIMIDMKRCIADADKYFRMKGTQLASTSLVCNAVMNLTNVLRKGVKHSLLRFRRAACKYFSPTRCRRCHVALLFSMSPSCD